MSKMITITMTEEEHEVLEKAVLDTANSMIRLHDPIMKLLNILNDSRPIEKADNNN